MTYQGPEIIFEDVGYQQLTLFGESELAAELYVDGALDGKTFERYLDESVSVSALPETETAVWPDDEQLENQYRRFLNAVPLEEDS